MVDRCMMLLAIVNISIIISLAFQVNKLSKNVTIMVTSKRNDLPTVFCMILIDPTPDIYQVKDWLLKLHSYDFLLFLRLSLRNCTLDGRSNAITMHFSQNWILQSKVNNIWDQSFQFWNQWVWSSMNTKNWVSKSLLHSETRIQSTAIMIGIWKRTTTHSYSWTIWRCFWKTRNRQILLRTATTFSMTISRRDIIVVAPAMFCRMRLCEECTKS